MRLLDIVDMKEISYRLEANYADTRAARVSNSLVCGSQHSGGLVGHARGILDLF